MKILCLDLGEKRVGVARSDEMGLLAHGVGFVERRSDEEALSRILQWVQEWQIGKIVVGLPRRMNGTAGRQVDKTLSFVELLKNKTSVEISLWDERLSSKAAEKFLLAGDLSRRKRKFVRDQLSAQIILQDFLDYHRRE